MRWFYGSDHGSTAKKMPPVTDVGQLWDASTRVAAGTRTARIPEEAPARLRASVWMRSAESRVCGLASRGLFGTESHALCSRLAAMGPPTNRMELPRKRQLGRTTRRQPGVGANLR
jgi:hypothetical protein